MTFKKLDRQSSEWLMTFITGQICVKPSTNQNHLFFTYNYQIAESGVKNNIQPIKIIYFHWTKLNDNKIYMTYYNLIKKNHNNQNGCVDNILALIVNVFWTDMHLLKVCRHVFVFTHMSICFKLAVWLVNKILLQ